MIVHIAEPAPDNWRRPSTGQSKRRGLNRCNREAQSVVRMLVLPRYTRGSGFSELGLGSYQLPICDRSRPIPDRYLCQILSVHSTVIHTGIQMALPMIHASIGTVVASHSILIVLYFREDVVGMTCVLAIQIEIANTPSIPNFPGV